MAYNELIGTLGEQSAAWYKEECRRYAEAAEQSATDAGNSATAADRDAGIASDKADIATNKANLAGESADLAQEWAIKTDGMVGGIDYSAKHYAGEASASADLAKDWATKMDGMVGGEDYSSKYYAGEAATDAQTASDKASEASGYADNAYRDAGIATNKAGEASASAQTASDKAGIATTQAGLAAGSALSASNSATLAEAWATKMDGQVDGDYSAKYYAGQASTSATNAGTSETNAGNSALLAKDWATKMDGMVDGSEYSSKYYAGQAGGSATAAAGSAADAQASADYIEDEAVKIDTTEKRVSNIEKLLQGNLYDYQTDSNSAYTKTVPSGAMPWASLDSVGGKTLAWNQLMYDGNFTDATVWRAESVPYSATSVANNELSITVIQTPTAFYNLGARRGNHFTSYVAGHKYLMQMEVYLPYASSAIVGRGPNIIDNASGQLTIASNVVANTWTQCSGIFTAKQANNTDIYIAPNTFADYQVGDTWKMRNYILVDLTLLYGSGNEPSTVAEFTAQFPAPYYAFNQGTLLSAGVTEVKSVGKNLAYYGGGKGVPSRTDISNTTPRFFTIGKYVVGFTINNYYQEGRVTSYSVTANSISLTVSQSGYGIGIPFNCVGGEKYTFSKTETASIGVGWFDQNGMFISYSGDTTGTLTATAPANARQGLLVLRPSANTPTTYSNIQIEHSTTATTYSAPFTISTPIPASIQALEGYGWSAGTVYNYIDFEAKKFVQEVGSRAYASGDESDSTVVTDMTTTYYPLNPAVETDISAYLTDDNLIEVEPNGTLTFPNSNGNDYRIPVPSAETYMVDLQEAI